VSGQLPRRGGKYRARYPRTDCTVCVDALANQAMNNRTFEVVDAATVALASGSVLTRFKEPFRSTVHSHVKRVPWRMRGRCCNLTKEGDVHRYRTVLTLHSLTSLKPRGTRKDRGSVSTFNKCKVAFLKHNSEC